MEIQFHGKSFLINDSEKERDKERGEKKRRIKTHETKCAIINFSRSLL